MSPFASSAAAMVPFNDGGLTVCDKSDCGGACANALDLQEADAVS